jgi:CMP-N-acetylneuraminic acid synthetase
MRIYKVECVDGVIEDTSFFYRHMGKGLEPVREMSFLQLERDDIFRRAGGLHLIKADIIKAKKDAWKSQTSHIVLDQKSAYHIKSELDFQMAEYLASQVTQK